MGPKRGTFFTFVSEHKAVHSKDATDFDLSGGLYNIPWDKIEEADRYLAHAIVSDVACFMVTKRAPGLNKLYFDLDVYERAPGWTKTTKLKVTRVIQATVLRLFPTCEPAELIVCDVDPVTIEKDGLRLIKGGLHLTWEGIICDTANAKQTRGAVLMALEDEFGPRLDPPGNDWPVVLDESVVTTNGLRRPYMNKPGKCNRCDLKGDVSCSGCHGSGRMDDGRPYRPLFVLRRDGTNDEEEVSRLTRVSQADWRAIARLLKKTLTRVDPTIKTGTPFRKDDEAVMAWGRGEKPTTQKAPPPTKKPTPAPPPSGREGQGEEREGEGGEDESEERDLDPSSEVFRAAAELVRECFGGLGHDAHLVRRLGRKRLRVISTGRRCANVEHETGNGAPWGEHRSNRVYFDITDAGIQQQCFCVCPSTHRRTCGFLEKAITCKEHNRRTSVVPVMPFMLVRLGFMKRTADFLDDEIEAQRRFKM